MSKHLNEIITRLGYSSSPCLKWKSNDYDSSNLAAHTIKVLNVLSPYAVYLVDNEPFVMFFDEPSNLDAQREIQKKVWNAQIPVVIFCGTAVLKVFNGCSIEEDTQFLCDVAELTFDKVDENSPFSFWEITNQNLWGEYKQKFSRKKLNGALLENLSALTDMLKNTYHLPFATKLVLRLIFIRYLIDRGVDLDYKGFSNDVAISQKSLLALLNKSSDLYTLFAHLKGKFNGNLFELDKNEHAGSLTESALCALKDFLSADIRTTKKQPSLFKLYDFNIIPVELISNIYEILLGSEARDNDNAFYTPKYLVDYILDMSIDGHIENHDNCRVLDPSCGSGIFLVNSYRRIIEKKLNGELYIKDDKLLINTLKDNIYGIDRNEGAIDVAIFSLYLALLDYKDPKTLKEFKLPPLKGSNLFVFDFFDEDGLMSLQEEVAFDFIIGNPPWSNKPGKHNDYCNKHGYKQLLQHNDTCRSFILRSKDFNKGSPTCCFVLKSTLLYLQKQKSKNFREFLLTKTKINHLIELSSVRKLVFKDAVAPAIILSYKFSDDNTIGNRFEHISLKPNLFFRLFNIIVVEKNDVKNVQQKMLMENDWAWKTLVYGLVGDIDIIMRLKKDANFITINDTISSHGLIPGTGIKYSEKNDSVNKKEVPLHIREKLFLESERITHFAINTNNMSKFSRKRVESLRNEKLYEAPYCLTLHGVDMEDYTMRSVYSEKDFVFRESVHAIKGLAKDKTTLLNLVGLLNSKAFSYFNLMLGSRIGIEREERRVNELLEFPYCYGDDIAAQVERIQEIKSRNGDFVVIDDATAEIGKLNRTILEAFGISDNEFVDYALRIQIPQLAKKNDHDAVRNVIVKDFEIYGRYFYDFLTAVFANAGRYIQINVYPKIARHYSVFEVVVSDMQPTEQMMFIDDDNGKQKEMLVKLSTHRINELFYQQKDVLYFEENSFYIIKPNYYKNWHPAIARIDLMEVTDQILSRKNGGKS